MSTADTIAGRYTPDAVDDDGVYTGSAAGSSTGSSPPPYPRASGTIRSENTTITNTP